MVGKINLHSYYLTKQTLCSNATYLQKAFQLPPLLAPKDKEAVDDYVSCNLVTVRKKRLPDSVIVRTLL